MTAGEHLFVYGTLKRGRSAKADWLSEKCLWVATATVEGSLVNLGAYPALLPPRQPGELVHGEVWRLPAGEILLEELDRYEGCHTSDPQPHEYRRIQIWAKLNDDSRILCWGYEYALSGAGKLLVEDGSW